MRNPTTLLFILGLLLLNRAHAELGGTSMALSSAAQLSAVTNQVSAQPSQYTVKKLTSQQGWELMEYADRSGLVFGMTWAGQSKPDMALLLGKYMARYNTALQAPLAGRAPVDIKDADVVIQTGGRMNAFFGTALLPLRAPAGFGFTEMN